MKFLPDTSRDRPPAAAISPRLVEGTSVRLLDSRKTLPRACGMAQKKYAVTCGGLPTNPAVGLVRLLFLNQGENHIAAAVAFWPKPSSQALNWQPGQAGGGRGWKNLERDASRPLSARRDIINAG